MSDFLASLVGRLDGSVATLRPRLPSLFETPAGEARLAAERPPPAEETVVTESAAPPGPSSEPRQAMQQPAAPPQPPVKTLVQTQIRAAQAEEDAVEAPAVSHRVVPPPPVPQDRPRVEPAARPVPRDTPMLPQKSPASFSEAPRRQPREPKADAAEPLSKQPSPQRKPALSQTPDASPQRRDAAAVAREETPAPALLRPAPPPFAPAPPPAALRSAQVQRAQATAGPRDAAEQTIHVTIGRIDIRAAAETPAPRKSREASPVMSLDDYLRSRAK